MFDNAVARQRRLQGAGKLPKEEDPEEAEPTESKKNTTKIVIGIVSAVVFLLFLGALVSYYRYRRGQGVLGTYKKNQDNKNRRWALRAS